LRGSHPLEAFFPQKIKCAIVGKAMAGKGLWLVLVRGFIMPGTNPGNEVVFKRHFMNCKHWGELIDERYF